MTLLFFLKSIIGLAIFVSIFLAIWLERKLFGTDHIYKKVGRADKRHDSKTNSLLRRIIIIVVMIIIVAIPIFWQYGCGLQCREVFLSFLRK